MGVAQVVVMRGRIETISGSTTDEYTVNTQYNAHFFNQNFNIKTGGCALYMGSFICIHVGMQKNTTFVV